MMRLYPVALGAALLVSLHAPGAAAAGGSSCSPHVEPESGGRGARLRSHTDAFLECTVDERSYATVLGAWLGAPPREDLEWISLGRMVEYPWLSRALVEHARGDGAWDAAAGKPRQGHANAYVAAVLEQPALATRLAAPLAANGYRLLGVSVEKVLVETAGRLPGASGRPGERLPYDAQTWLRIERAR